MGDWQHPPHYTPDAQAYHQRVRAAEIAIFIDHALPELRQVARELGWSVCIHGSLQRDMDLVAVPWVDDAKPMKDLVTALAAATKRMTGWGHITGGEWTAKPQGRTAITLLASAEVHIDLSVMPRLGNTPT